MISGVDPKSSIAGGRPRGMFDGDEPRTLMPELVLTDTPQARDREAIVAGLVAYNRVNRIANDWRPIAVLIKEGDRTIGGLSGWTMWGWMFVELLFIPGIHRGRGLGTRILAQAEEEAWRRGCHSALLDTHTWQARPFYEKQGWEVFGELADYPTGQTRFYLRKRLGLHPAR